MRNNGRWTASEELIQLGAGDLIDIVDNTSRHKDIEFPGHKHATLYDVNLIEGKVSKYLDKIGINIHIESRVIDVKVENKKIKVRKVKKGDRVVIERNVFFDILWPQEEQISDNPLNNNSMVAKLQYFEFSMLFTGDIEKIAEQQILEVTTSEYLRADILKVAHHGSNTSSIDEFIKEVKPKIALIGVGENNNFGHPADEVIDRFQAIKTEIYRTDKMGEIVLEVNKKGICKVNNCINLTKPVNTSKKYLRRNCYE